MSTDDSAVIKSIRRKVNGTGKRKAAPKAPSITMAEIEAIVGAPINFNSIYERSDEPVRRKLFASAAAQQLRDFVNSYRVKYPDASNLQIMIREWLPVLKRRGKSPIEKASKFIGSMSAEERAEMVRLLGAERIAE